MPAPLDRAKELIALGEKATPGPWYSPCLGIIRHDGRADPKMGVVDIGEIGAYRDKELLPFNKERWDADMALVLAARHAPEIAGLLVEAEKHIGALSRMLEAAYRQIGISPHSKPRLVEACDFIAKLNGASND